MEQSGMEQSNLEASGAEQSAKVQTKSAQTGTKGKPAFDYAFYVRLLLTALLAFIGTYYTLPQRGLISTLPVYFIAALAAAPVRVPIWQKAAIFGIFAFTFTTLYYEASYAVIFAAICVLTVLICTYAFRLLKKRKALSAIVSILLICVGAVPHPLLFGNFIDGLDADKTIREYVSKHYTGDGIVVSGTAYDFHTGCYKATIYDEKALTERYSLSVYNSRLTDSFKRFAELKLMEKRTLEITAALREQFPNERFAVDPLEICGYPQKEQISLSDTGNYNDNMRFKIHVPGFLYKKDFAKKVESYYNTLLKAKLSFREVVFIGGGSYLNAMSIAVPYDLLPKDMEKLIKPSYTPPLMRDFALA